MVNSLNTFHTKIKWITVDLSKNFSVKALLQYCFHAWKYFQEQGGFVIGLIFLLSFLVEASCRGKEKTRHESTHGGEMPVLFVVTSFEKTSEKRQLFLLEVPSVKDFWDRTTVQLCRMIWVLKAVPIQSIVNHLWSLEPRFCFLSTLKQY